MKAHIIHPVCVMYTQMSGATWEEEAFFFYRCVLEVGIIRVHVCTDLYGFLRVKDDALCRNEVTVSRVFNA